MTAAHGSVNPGVADPALRPHARRISVLTVLLAGISVLLLAAGAAVGSLGWEPLWGAADGARAIVWDIRLPRSVGAWLAGALLGVAGGIAPNATSSTATPNAAPVALPIR